MDGTGAPEAGWDEVEDDGFIAHVGPIYRLERPGEPDLLGFRAAEQHANLNGVVQGGMMMTIADRALGRTARRLVEAPVATVSFGYDFLGPAHIGSFVIVTPKVTRRAGTLIFMEGLATVEGDPIGRATGVWKKLSRPPLERLGEKG